MSFKHFNQSLAITNPYIANVLEKEFIRQKDQLQLIASENYASLAVIQTQGTILTNKYAEGYPGNRYYAGCEEIDNIENKAIRLACELFQCKYANVQPHSGSQANQAVMLALLNANDVILSMDLNHGGHLTHGSEVNLSGKWLNAIGYHVDNNGLIDMNEVRNLALKNKPKLIIAGSSSYSRVIDWASFKDIANEVGATFLADIAHFAGLIVGKSYPGPFPYADIVTTTTHKVLRGPRGGLILCNNSELASKIDKAVFPGIQGGPLMHVIAAKAVSFAEALQPEFKDYIEQVINNSKTMANVFKQRGLDIVSNDTDSHLVLINLTKLNGLTGLEAVTVLNQSGLIANKNSIPNDYYPSFITSGVRIGSPACTTRGMKEAEFEIIANLIADICLELAENRFNIPNILNNITEMKEFKIQLPNIMHEIKKQKKHFSIKTNEIKVKIRLLCSKFPIYEKILC